MGFKSQSIELQLISYSDFTKLNKNGNWNAEIPKYYIGENYHLIKKSHLNIVNIDYCSKEQNESIKHFMVNLDTYFEPKWFSFTNTCSANRYICTLYDDILQATTLLKFIKNEKREMIIVVDTEQKYWIIKEFLIDNQIRVKSNQHELLNGIKKRSRYIIMLIFNLLRKIRTYWKSHVLYWRYLIQAIKLHKLNSNRSYSKINILCWINAEDIDVDHLYRENKYFGFLPDFLNKHATVSFIGHVLYGSKLYPKIAKGCIARGLPIFFIMEHIKIKDIFCSQILSIYHWIKASKKIIYEGIDYSIFVKKSLQNDFFDGSFQMGIIFYLLFKRILKNLPNESMIIYPFENQPWEKTLLRANSDLRNEIRMLAYQFFPLTQNFPIYQFSSKAKNLGAIPNKVLTSDVLSNQFFLNETISTLPIGNFRLEKLAKTENCSTFKRGRPEILCSLFLEEKEAIGLLQKVLSMSMGLDCQIWINYHPMLPKHCVVKIQSMLNGFDNVSLSEKSATQLLDKVSIVLYHSTSVCWEAALRGIPIIYVECDNLPNLDRFNSRAESIQQVEEGKKLIQTLLQDKQYYFDYAQKLYSLSREMLFSISEEKMEQIWA